jgi:hypothetical protein
MNRLIFPPFLFPFLFFGSVVDSASELDHVLCLVDARQNMFEKNSDGETYFCMAMKVIHKILRTKIINSDKNLVGVTMFGTMKKTSPDSPHDHVFTLINLGKHFHHDICFSSF